MTTRTCIPAFLAILLLAIPACGLPAPAPSQADPNAFNTMVAQTALARPTIPPAMTAPPTIIPPALAPNLPPTPAGPAVLMNVTLSLPRHTAIDLDTQATSGPYNTPPVEKYQTSIPDKDVLFYGPYPNSPEYQFLALLNTARLALPPYKLTLASYQNCVTAFAQGGIFGVGLELISFPLDVNTFQEGGLPGPGGYLCFVTDKGKVGAMLITTPGDFVGAQSVTINYILWDAKLP